MSEKEATVNTVAESKTYADILGDIPAFSGCAKDALDDFANRRVFTMHTGAGREVCTLTDSSHILYVLVAGSAFLDTGDGVRVALEPGDYFGGASARRHHKLAASVVAEADVEVLVISPAEVSRLQQASPRRRHPSNAEWSPELTAPSLTLIPTHRRRAVLARSAS